jgi:hypothetical protein
LFVEFFNEYARSAKRVLRQNPISANLRKNNQYLLLKNLYPHQKTLYSPPLRRGLGMKSPAGFGAEPHKRELNKKINNPFS